MLAGVNLFKETLSLDVQGLEPRIDSPSYSIIAWVQLKKGQGANILRKPVGEAPDEKSHSCWGWYVASLEDSFLFGGHGEIEKQH